MTKIKATRKDMIKQFPNAYSVGYCDLQFLLNAYKATYYNAGVFGWNWDGYMIDLDTVIVTGYRNTVGKPIPYEISEKYNNLAADVYKNSKFNWTETKAQLETLMAQMLEELKEG